MKKLVSIILGLVLTLSIFVVPVSVAKADTYYDGTTAIAWDQRNSNWAWYYYGGGSIYDTACGIVSTCNAINYLHGSFNIADKAKTFILDWASYANSINGFNPGSASGTYRYVTFGTDYSNPPPLQTRYGNTYDFEMPILWTETWNSANLYNGNYYNNIYVNSQTSLKNYLAGDAVAVAHVPGHFICLADYNPTTDSFLVLDFYPTTARGTGNGVAWVTANELSGGRPSLTVGGFCVLKSTASTNTKVPYTLDDNTLMIHDGESVSGWTGAFNTEVAKHPSASQGSSSFSMFSTTPTAQQASNTGKIGAMAKYQYSTSIDLTDYKSIAFDYYLPYSFNNQEAELELNFCTNNPDDGYNIRWDISNQSQGWYTKKINISDIAKVNDSADWSKITNLRFTWWNKCSREEKIIFLLDNIRASKLDASEVADTVIPMGIASPKGKVLKVTYENGTASTSGYKYLDLAKATIRVGYRLAYDVYLCDDVAGIGGIEIDDKYSNFARDNENFVDQNGVIGHPKADISDYAYGKWYHREMYFPGNWDGTGYSYFYVMIAFDGGFTGSATAYFDNIRIVDSQGNTVESFFVDGGDEYSYVNDASVSKGNSYESTNYNGVNAEVVDASSLDIPDFIPDYVLKVTYDNYIKDKQGYKYLDKAAATFYTGYKFAYDVFLADDVAGIGGLDLDDKYNTYARDDANFVDQNGLSGHPKTDISDYAYGKWYHRELSIPSHWNGTGYAAFYTMIAFDGGFYGSATAYFDNICILDSNGNVVEYFFKDGDSEYNFENNTNVVKGTDYSYTNYAGLNATVVPKSEVKPIEEPMTIEKVIEEIEKLPNFHEANDSHRELFAKVKEAYEKLDDTQKENVSNIDKLFRNQARLDALEGKIIYGDVDMNGEVSVVDALSALQYSVSLIQLNYNQFEAGRVGAKEQVTAEDALLILQKSVGKITAFPVQQ